MAEVIGVRFKEVGKVYYFDPKDIELKTGDMVIVETARGIECGQVAIPNKNVDDEEIIHPLKPLIRKATDNDIAHVEENKKRQKEAFKICEKKIAEHNLKMNLVEVEYTFDNNKILFYFTADGRVDFRNLVKDLASVFRTRIELRQIGVRDEAKMLGGLGVCGRPFCCHSFLGDFQPVSIKMAKEQNLSLNPTKISGVCGRLMCCLKNEQETYEYLNSRLPAIGDTVTASDGTKGEVTSINVLRQLVKVIVDNGEEKELREYAIDDLRFKSRRKKDIMITEEELKELEGLEEDPVETMETEEKQEKRPRPKNKEKRDYNNNNSNNNYNNYNNNSDNYKDNGNKKPNNNHYNKRKPNKGKRNNNGNGRPQQSNQK